MDNNLTVAEVTHATEMQQDLQRKLLEAQRAEAVSSVESIRGAVLGLVVSEAYDRAREDLKAYVEAKSEYPNFQYRVERYVQHCDELIGAIETKRNFPGLATLSLSKQQEIHEKVLEHFDELKGNLKHIEKVERDQKLTDVRSTVWVLKTLTYVTGAVFATGFLIDLQSGLLSSTVFVTETYLSEFATWVVNLIPL